MIQAPIEKCFDMARDIDLHMKSVSDTDEQAIGGTTSGLIGPGETVTWRARHLGITQYFTSKITAFDRPNYFQDAMQQGAFKSFVHDHYFSVKHGQTSMLDVVEFQSPFWLLGSAVDALFMKSYLYRLISKRCKFIKESAEWSFRRT